MVEKKKKNKTDVKKAYTAEVLGSAVKKKRKIR